MQRHRQPAKSWKRKNHTKSMMPKGAAPAWAKKALKDPSDPMHAQALVVMARFH